jgi:hypothetical protein
VGSVPAAVVLRHPVDVIEDGDEGQTVYLTWELEQAWSSADLDALVVALPGEPCVQEPTDQAGRVVIISMELSEADELSAARTAQAAVRGVLAPRGLGGRVTEAVVYTEGASWTVDTEELESWVTNA